MDTTLPPKKRNTTLPPKKRKLLLIIQDGDQTSNDVTSESKPRHSSEKVEDNKEQEQQGKDTSVVLEIPEWALKRRRGTTIRLGKLLFKKKLTLSDATGSFLHIPNNFAKALRCDIVWNNVKQGAPKKHELKFTDKENREREMEFTYYQINRTYALVRGWKEYVQDHNLEQNDVVYIYKFQNHKENHYFITYEKAASRKSNGGSGKETLGGSKEQSHNGSRKGKETISGK
ncbi:hypothetical protein F0562_020987 [Nyssa sinensis]|uniref:TF-B3 domain-containing protein n=1 Tax=Nyssa sinensis TaxID=561372 RepID=A0A5J5BLH0_9ASTE|nr:hypothetical protein F0562_020987 [Nyssa sinensis]